MATPMKREKQQTTALAERGALGDEMIRSVEAAVDEMVAAGQLNLPQNYSRGNALASAWLKIKRVEDKDGELALDVCTKESVYNALMDMVVQALNPAKDQCYFIVYGNQLTCQRSYFGDEAVVRLIDPGADIFANPVWKGDKDNYKHDLLKRDVVEHDNDPENITGRLEDIYAAYCVIRPSEGPNVFVFRKLDQIKQSWSASRTWKPGEAGTMHEDQPEVATVRTVVRRAAKEFINRSNDEHLVAAISRQDSLATLAGADEAALAEEREAELIDVDGDVVDAGTGELVEEDEELEADAADESDAVEAEAEEPEQDPEPSPADRMMKLIKSEGLNAKLVVEMLCDIHGVERVGSEQYEATLEDPETFLALYREKHGDDEGG